jgi:beta-lactamase class A
MRSDIKYIGVGSFIGGGLAAIVILGLFLTGHIETGTPPTSTSEIIVPTETAANLVFVPGVVPTSTSMPTVTPLPTPTVDQNPSAEEESLLAGQINQTLLNYGGDWNILIREDGDRTVYSHASDQIVHVASIIKVPVAMLFFRMLEEQGIKPSEYADYLSTRGVGRTYQQLLKAMLVESEEDATGTLKTVIAESKLDVKAALQSWGAIHTDIGKRHSTAEDVAKLYEALYFGRAITPEGRQIILDYMSAYTPNDDTRLGVLRPSLPPGAKFYNKRGTVTEGVLIVGDAAIFTWPQDGKEKVYVAIILGYPGDSSLSDIKLVKGVEEIAREFWSFAAPKNP